MKVYRRKTKHPDGTVTEHPTYYFSYWRNGRKIRQSTGSKIRKNAQRIADVECEKQNQRARGVVLDEDTDVPATTLTALSAKYLEFAKHDHPASADDDARIVARFIELAGGTDGGNTFIHTISAGTIKHWRNKRMEDTTRRGTRVTASAVNRELNVVRAMFREAVVDGLLKRSPCGAGKQAIRDFKTGGKDIRILTAAELDRAFTLLPAPFNLICEITFRTLARLREVTSLRAEHVRVDILPDGQRIGTLQKRVKGGKWKRVRIPLALAEQLTALVTSAEQVHIFPDHQHSDSVSATIHRALRVIGIRASHHAFRHSGITRMLEAGVNPRAIQEHAGWSSLKQLQRYGHVLDQEFARAVEATDEFLQRHRTAAKTGTDSAPALTLVQTGGAR